MAKLFKQHVFFCTHSRDDSSNCAEHKAQSLRDYAKKKVKKLKLKKVRINSAGCLGRCSLGPILVIYPEGVWYQYQSKQDIDLIIESQLQNNRIVEHLKR
ncbi:MAG: 2Fe-2S ferredoxin [Gammaproteobacteria bacterium]|nr:MAG: 2Fe-2S ferredoxin [Gammaproteobacteria bacterium]